MACQLPPNKMLDPLLDRLTIMPYKVPVRLDLRQYRPNCYQLTLYAQRPILNPFTADPVKAATVKRPILTLSPPILLRLYTLPYWSNPLLLISDIRALWRSGLSQSARMSENNNSGL